MWGMRVRNTAWFLWSAAILSACDFSSTEPEATHAQANAAKGDHSTVIAEFAREAQMEIPAVSATAADDLSSRGPILEKGSPGLERRRGTYVYRGTPFVGVIERRFPNGKIHSRTRYHAGKEHGKAYTWHENGALREERRFKEGRKHGRHRGWWRDGSARFLYSFVDGDYDGECLDWHASGQIAQARYYELGSEVGHQRSWSPNGKLLANYVVKDSRRYGRLGARPCYTTRNDD